VLERVKPEREQNNRASYWDIWWVFGEPRREIRPALFGLKRFIVTIVTAKHRLFTFVNGEILPDDALIVIALSDAYSLGALSSRVHVVGRSAPAALWKIVSVITSRAASIRFRFPIAATVSSQRLRLSPKIWTQCAKSARGFIRI
jgi:hypothetical protein